MPSLFIDPNAEAEYNEEENKTVLDMILDINQGDISPLTPFLRERFKENRRFSFFKGKV